LPYKTATGKVYDSGDFTAHMKRAMEVADWKEFPKRAKAAKKQGLVRGIGLASYVEVCGTMGEETANVRLDPDGDVTILIGTQSSGQGHQTAYAQLVSEQFGIPPERIHIHQATPTRSRPVSAPAARPRFPPAASASSALPASSVAS